MSVIMSIFFRNLLVTVLCFNLSLVSTYDIGCIYPPMMNEDLMLSRDELSLFIASEFEVTGTSNQPVNVHTTFAFVSCEAMCLAYHDSHMLDPFRKQELFMRVPSFGQNPYSANMCQYQCALYVFEGATGKGLLFQEHVKNEMGLDLGTSDSRNDIKNAMWLLNLGDDTLIMNILEAEDYHPITVGHLVGIDVMFRFGNDGMNRDGGMTWSRTLQEAVPCSNDCKKYQDFTGHVPVLDPRKHSSRMQKKRNKYDCTGTCRNWQPLEVNENTVESYLMLQKFMTPHIGASATTYLRNATLTLEDPMIDYFEESLLLIERMKDGYSDPVKVDMINFFHGTFSGMGEHAVRGFLDVVARLQLVGKHSYQDHLLMNFGLSLVEFDGLIQAWHEKVHHDLVRPTTVIRHWDNDVLAVVGVPDGPNRILHARDFATHAVTPASAEFPSANACICTAFAEFMDIFTPELYNETLSDIGMINELFAVAFDDMADFREKCGLSRLWSGVAYPASVEAGEQICSGLGQLGFDHVQEIRNGSPSAWMPGDTLPACPQ